MVKKTTPPVNTRRYDVSCRLLFVADIDETLLEHGSGFLMHVLTQEALRLLKAGKPMQDFHLTVVDAVALKRSDRLIMDDTAREQLLWEFMHYLASDPGTNLVVEGADPNRQIITNFLARKVEPGKEKA